MGTGLRYYGKKVPTDQLFRGSCLLTHLHWDHVQGLPFFTPLLREGFESRCLRSGTGRRPLARRGRVVHDSSAAVSRERRRVARHRPLPRHGRLRFLDRRVQRDGPAHPAPRADPRLSGRVEWSLDRLPLGSPATIRWQLLGCARRARTGRRRRPVDPRLAVHAARVRGQGDVGPLHHRVRRVAGLLRAASSNWRSFTTTRLDATTISTGCCVAPQRAGRGAASR